MKKKTLYTDAPPEVEEALETAVRITDFLPSPEQLAEKETDTKKVTIALTKRSLSLFQKYARKHRAKYQYMIRRLVHSYAEHKLSTKV
jgi:predicted DNA binding CopG/RHH family protein